MDWKKTIFKGLQHFVISFLVLVLTGVSTALSGFQPADQLSVLLWSAVGASIIGGINSLINWLKNKDK